MRAIIHLVIEVPYEVSDSGYLGTTTSSIDDHIKSAKEEVHRHEVYLKKNTDKEPKRVSATFRVSKVVLEP